MKTQSWKEDEVKCGDVSKGEKPINWLLIHFLHLQVGFLWQKIIESKQLNTLDESPTRFPVSHKLVQGMCHNCDYDLHRRGVNL